MTNNEMENDWCHFDIEYSGIVIWYNNSTFWFRFLGNTSLYCHSPLIRWQQGMYLHTFYVRRMPLEWRNDRLWEGIKSRSVSSAGVTCYWYNQIHMHGVNGLSLNRGIPFSSHACKCPVALLVVLLYRTQPGLISLSLFGHLWCVKRPIAAFSSTCLHYLFYINCPCTRSSRTRRCGSGNIDVSGPVPQGTVSCTGNWFSGITPP